MPQVLIDPWNEGPAFSTEEAGCVAAALEPVARNDLAAGFGETVVAGLLARGVLAPAPAHGGMWHRYGWGRPQAFLAAADAHRARTAPAVPPVAGPVAGVLSEREDVAKALQRRSVRKFARKALPREDLEAVLAAVGRLMASWPHMRLYVAAQQVDHVPEGVHAYRPGDGSLMLLRPGVDGHGMLAATHQFWSLGSGAVLLIGVCWRDLERAHGGGPDAYLHALTECGRLGHVAVLAATVRGLGAWMTPAIDEEAIAELCGLGDLEGKGGDVLYMIKIGQPREDEQQ
ncbi:hypothetical protein SABIM44S_00013 [Streptomyces abikoensis]